MNTIDDGTIQKRGYRRMENRRLQICEVAAKLFTQHGYDGTKLEMIAEELGYTRANLYHYVKSKEEVLALLSEDFVHKQLENAQFVTMGDMSTIQRLERFIDAHVRFVCTSESALLWNYNPIGKIDQYFERFPAVMTAGEEYISFARGLLQQGIDEGIILVRDVKIAASTLIGALNSIPQWFNPDGTLSIDQVIKRTSEMLLGGLISPRF